MNRRTILIASRNRGKAREILAILSGLRAEFETLEAYPELPEVEEDADSFEGNARLKAMHYAGLTGRWTIADDSGLEVDALGGEPGIHSARFAGGHGDDAANNAKLISQLHEVPPEKRRARFRCCVVLADEGGVLATAEGAFDGVVVDEARGRNGFGYDPHFYVSELGMTAAEMPPELKNALSHRARALQQLRPKLMALLG